MAYTFTMRCVACKAKRDVGEDEAEHAECEKCGSPMTVVKVVRH